MAKLDAGVIEISPFPCARSIDVRRTSRQVATCHYGVLLGTVDVTHENEFDIEERLVTALCELARGAADSPAQLADVVFRCHQTILGVSTPERQRRVEAAIVTSLTILLSEDHNPLTTDAPSLAPFYHAILLGMATEARGGASKEKLVMIARTAMAASPIKTA